MKLRTIRDIKIKRGERVLLRIDTNVPFRNGIITDDSRLWAVLPSLQYLAGRGAVVILLAHLGRPKGHTVRELSLAPIAKRLSQISGHLVSFIPDLGGPKTVATLSAAIPGQIFMLENVRFDRGEESNSGSLAKRLSGLADYYVNDGFGVAHRAHASVNAITRHLPSYAGLLMERELMVLTHVREQPEAPSVALMGGAKISTKITLLRALHRTYTDVFVGGGLANVLIAAAGFGVGASYREGGTTTIAEALLKYKNVHLPVDVLVGTPGAPNAKVRVVPVATTDPFVICRASEAIVDIGPRTILSWAGYLKKAKTILWNGPLGIFETPKFSHGTIALARIVAARARGRALAVVGGGETVEALARTGMAKYVDHISTGGGAMLEFLEGRMLPGVKPLFASEKKVIKRKK